MSDFDPEIRNAAIWSGDSRRIAKGDAAGVVLEKLGRTEHENLDDEESVQMGKMLEPVVARIFEETHNCRLKHIDGALTHRKHAWLRSHFDYEAEDRSYLVETKNYHHHAAQYFSEMGDPVRVPDADRAQCLHEAIVHGVSTVYLAVLFGGQRYRDFRFDFAPEEKEAWIERLAEVWANVQTSTMPPPATAAQAREMWPQDNGHSIVANKQIEFLCLQLAQYKEQAKGMDNFIDEATAAIQGFMGDRAELVAVDGKTLATWKTAKSSRRFSADLLKTSMPDIYEKFITEQTGSRRFLIK